MAKHRAWLVVVILGLAVLGASSALGAPVPGAWQDWPSSPPPLAPAQMPSDSAPVVVRLAGNTPDGSFNDLQSLAGTRQLAPNLNRTNGNSAPGIYMARDWRAVNKAEFPMLTGGHDTFTWGELEPVEGSYDWRRLDDMIAANASTGKTSAFGITTYNGRIEDGIVIPSWMITGLPQTTIDCGSGWKIPRYWNSVYQTKYRNFVTALANRYKNDNRVAWQQIGVGLYGEIQPSDDDGTRGAIDTTCVIQAMKTDFGSAVDQFQKWIDTINQITDIFMQNFDTGQPTFLVYTPSFVNVNEKCYSTLYGAGKYNGFGLFVGGIFANQTGIFANWPAITYPYGCSKWDPILYWNNSPTATVPIAMESYRYMLPDLDTFYWGILNGLNKHPDYFNLESDLFFSNRDPQQKIAENFPMMYFAAPYLGATINTTPNAWVAMREYDPATNGVGFHVNYVKPQWGNYDFWLYQDDNIAGGKTISATTVSVYSDTHALVWRNDPFYDPILADKGPQGWTTRRTSHATGNDYMYLDIDDDFVAARGLQHSATVTVTWFDVITATGTTWALQYVDTGGSVQSIPVERHNTRQWQTSIFNITGADFSNGWTGSSRPLDNLRIYNGGTADLYVHMVMVGPLSGPTPTPTATITPGGPTLTSTPTSTVTATPTSTSTPRPGYQLRINAGDGAYLDSGSQVWHADQEYTAGSWGWYTLSGTSKTYCTGSPISGTADPALYQCERYWTGAGGYTATVPNGDYYVQLRFAEIYYTEPDQRRFGVSIQGVNVISNLDLVATMGPLTTYDPTFLAQVTNGLLHIEFAGALDAAKVNAIHIFSVGGATATPTATYLPSQTPTTTSTAANTPTVTPTASPGYQLRINAGGPDYVDSSGQLWHADQPYSTGSWGWYARTCSCQWGCSNTYATGSPINNTGDPTLYQTERHWCDTGGYMVTVPNGSYNVQLHLAEIYYTHPNERVFDVMIQGTTVSDNLDLVALAGSLTAYEPTFYNIQVSNGLLYIEFVAEFVNELHPRSGAMVNAIYIYSGGQTGTPTATPAPTDCSAVSEIPVAECQALVALYNSTNGTGWWNHGNWLANNTPCTWRGVTCAAGHVASLDLPDNQLSGAIPPQLGNLANLVRLDLQGNQLSGNIPPELGDLSNVQGLYLYYNHLSGSIPGQLGNLSNLQALGLAGNRQLSGELPLSLMNLHLAVFLFENTSLCEPGDLAFQAWLASIHTLGRTSVICVNGSPTVTATPSSTPTPTRTPVLRRYLPVVMSD